MFTGSQFGKAQHGTFIDWVFRREIQTPKNGGTSYGMRPNSGRLTFGFDLAGVDNPILQFLTWWEIESVDPDRFDIMDVLLEYANDPPHRLIRLNPTVDANGPPDVPYTSADTPADFNRNQPKSPVWFQHNIPLSRWSGQKVKVVFFFDTVDHLYNGFRGWAIASPRVIPQSRLGLSLHSRWTMDVPGRPRNPWRPRD